MVPSRASPTQQSQRTSPPPPRPQRRKRRPPILPRPPRPTSRTRSRWLPCVTSRSSPLPSPRIHTCATSMRSSAPGWPLHHGMQTLPVRRARALIPTCRPHHDAVLQHIPSSTSRAPLLTASVSSRPRQTRRDHSPPPPTPFQDCQCLLPAVRPSLKPSPWPPFARDLCGGAQYAPSHYPLTYHRLPLGALVFQADEHTCLGVYMADQFTVGHDVDLATYISLLTLNPS